MELSKLKQLESLLNDFSNEHGDVSEAQDKVDEVMIDMNIVNGTDPFEDLEDDLDIEF